VSLEDLISLLRRRRRVFLSVFVLCLGAVVILTLLLPKTYKATATIYAGVGNNTLDTSQSEQIIRTYAALAANPNVASLAAQQLGGGLTSTKLLDKLSFAPVESTQLLTISAEDDTPQGATRIANTYANVFVNRANSQAAQGQGGAQLTVSEPATPPTGPAKPNRPLYIGFGVILSLLLALGVTVARDRLDRRLQLTEADDTLLNEPIVARIPNIALHEPNGLTRSAAAMARTVRMDAFRVLRTNLDMTQPDNARVLMVTSPGPDEGKTTVAIQLALAAATDGDDVALIECDLRRPGFDLWVNNKKLAAPAAGLSDYLAGKKTETEVIHSIRGVPNLQVLWAGTPASEPSRLLRSPRMGKLLERLHSQNDWVIVNTPPITSGDDAMLITQHVQGVLYVVDLTGTTVPAARAGLGQLRRIRTRVLGVVVNNVPIGWASGYGYPGWYEPESAPAGKRG
jgi:succinoglycan biosynthesis transport protein ExoP